MMLRLSRKCFNGSLRFYTHESKVCAGPMNFAIFLPSRAKTERCPVLFYISGLTCTDENFVMKAGAQRVAEELGMIIVAPDTSPRDRGIPGEKDGDRPGEGASYYVDALKEPWSRAYQMYSYIAFELPDLIDAQFLTLQGQRSIMGHSMGGHGALVVGLRNPDRFRSISALAPICAPSQSPNAQKAFQAMLGGDKEAWAAYDAVELLRSHGCTSKILVDQGTEDDMIENLRPQDLIDVAREKNLPIEVRMQQGYDHSYYFVATFIEDHLHFHHARLQGHQPS
jgi:S-formylglutathione hydrolase